MTNITLAIPEDLHTKMKQHSEIRWSEVVRKTISQKIEDLTYWENIEFLHTGDLAKEKDGLFYIIGRLKRFIKIFGSRVNLDELESFLKNNYPGTVFATVGINDKNIIIAVNNNIITAEQIKNYLQNSFKIHPSVVKIFYLKEFPLTSNGKINYNKIIELYESK